MKKIRESFLEEVIAHLRFANNETDANEKQAFHAGDTEYYYPVGLGNRSCRALLC